MPDDLKKLQEKILRAKHIEPGALCQVFPEDFALFEKFAICLGSDGTAGNRDRVLFLTRNSVISVSDLLFVRIIT